MAPTSANTLDDTSSMNYEADVMSGMRAQTEASFKREFQKRKNETIKKYSKIALKRVSDKFELGDELEDIIDGMGDEPATATGKKVSQLASRTAFKVARKKAIKKAKEEAAARLAKKLATKGAVRTVSISIGVTGVGLIVTYLIWTVQVIAGNLMGSKWIPRLASLGDFLFWWELPLWMLMTIFVLMGILILFILLTVALIFSNPVVAATILGWSIVNAITG